MTHTAERVAGLWGTHGSGNSLTKRNRPVTDAPPTDTEEYQEQLRLV